MYPILAFFLALTSISPESNSLRPTIQCNKVVFPQPLGPSRPYLKNDTNIITVHVYRVLLPSKLENVRINSDVLTDGTFFFFFSIIVSMPHNYIEFYLNIFQYNLPPLLAKTNFSITLGIFKVCI